VNLLAPLRPVLGYGDPLIEVFRNTLTFEHAFMFSYRILAGNSAETMRKVKFVPTRRDFRTRTRTNTNPDDRADAISVVGNKQ